MRKGTLEYCVLAVLHEQESYPSEIIAKLKEQDLIVIEGTLYPILNRLKKSDFVTYRWQESTEGPPRKYFKITKTGTQALKEIHQAWQKYYTAVNTITQNTLH